MGRPRPALPARHQHRRPLGLIAHVGASFHAIRLAGAQGYQIAFQANTSSLFTTGDLGTIDYQLGMAPGTSPSSTPLDFDNTTSLFTTGVLGTEDHGPGMQAGTSPSISRRGNVGGYNLVFQANTGNLWTAGTNGEVGDLGFGMQSSTSPALAR